MARPQAPRGQGRARVINAALDQFAVHGVSGTSLQMIADHLGVTKAAVYYQFHAKEEIVLAVVEDAFDDLFRFLDVAQAAPSPDEAAAAALAGLVDLVVDHRRAVSTLFGDPEAGRVIESHHRFQGLKERLGDLLLGPEPDVRRRVAVTLVGAGTAQAAMSPDLADVADETLREELLHTARVLLAAVAGDS
ncbi:MAG: TetR/AcrR family transcriptional regulator [Nocardioides sp.]